MDAEANNKLIEVGAKLRSEREESVRTIAELKSANEEQRRALDAIGSGWIQWKHPDELASATCKRLTGLYERLTKHRNVLGKILLTVSPGAHYREPDEVLAAVAGFVDSQSKSVSADVSQQLEPEVQANIELRKQLSKEAELTKQVRQALEDMRDEARIANQAVAHWQRQAGTTESALFKAKKERAEELQSLRESNTKLRKQLEAEYKRAEVAEHKLSQREEPSPGFHDVMLSVTTALRAAMQTVKKQQLPTDNSVRFAKRYNAGLMAGAAIVEVHVYNALPRQEE